LGYTVPETMLTKLGISSLRLYTVADNAILIFNKSGADAFTGPDPETPGSIYPRPIRITFGLDVRF
jgi:hypothetical protein